MTINEFNKESTIDNPLGFFEYFFLGGGFQLFHKNFFGVVNKEKGEYEGSPLLYDVILEVNKVEEFICYTDATWEGSFVDRKSFFKDELKKCLSTQKSVSIRLIRRKINSMIDEDKKIVPYLQLLTGNLNLLLIGINEKSDFSKYWIAKSTISEIIKYLYDVYNPFFKDIESPCIKEAIEYLVQNTILKPENELPAPIKEPVRVKAIQKSVNGFNWNCEPEYIGLNTILLFDILKNNKVITGDNITLDNFKLAFSGTVLENPLNIKWLLAKNDVHPKPILVRAIKHILMDELKAIVEIDNGKLTRVVEMIFVDKDGKPFDNLINAWTQTECKTCRLAEKNLHEELRSAKFIINPANNS